MKTLVKILPVRLHKVLLVLLSVLLCVPMFAQEGETKKIDVDINTGGGDSFFASPWVWALGAAVFILLLVALLRGGKRGDA